MRELTRHELCASLLHMCTAQAVHTGASRIQPIPVAATAKVSCVECKAADLWRPAGWLRDEFRDRCGQHNHGQPSRMAR